METNMKGNNGTQAWRIKWKANMKDKEKAKMAERHEEQKWRAKPRRERRREGNKKKVDETRRGNRKNKRFFFATKQKKIQPIKLPYLSHVII